MAPDMISPSETTDTQVRDRSRLAAWLAGAIGQPGPPEPFVLDPSADGELDPAARRVARLLEWATAEDAETWESERVRLVVNAPGGIAFPLAASWWIDGGIGGPTAEATAAFLREEGLLVSASAGTPDALPALLELMHVLLQHQHAAHLTAQPELAVRAREREAELLQRFLVPWIPRACEAGREASESPWWRSVFDLLETLIAREADRLGLPSPPR